MQSKKKPYENLKIDSNIKTKKLFNIPKMEDLYLGVQFKYSSKTWNGCIPLRTKYQGLSIPDTLDDVCKWAKKCYNTLNPANYQLWQDNQIRFWNERNAPETRVVFNALNGNNSTTEWLCRKCGPVPRSNPQPGGRIRALRSCGYYTATQLQYCKTCGQKESFDLLIRLPRAEINSQERHPISEALRKKVIKTLSCKDACFGDKLEPSQAIVDHKFPSSRWVVGEPTPNRDDMPEEEIRRKFQILTNQTNLQKERYCKRCVLDGIRGDFFGIKWYYQGNENWEGQSKVDERGCIGCPWYDLLKWKEEFNRVLKKISEGNKNIPNIKDNDSQR